MVFWCFGVCGDGDKVCGARLAFQTQKSGGWFVVDDIRGSVSFEGLTFQVRDISSGFGGDGASFDKEVLEIGLPSSVKFRDYQYTLGYASHASPGDSASYQQTNIYGVQINGKVNMTGNMLIFPTADK